MTGEIITADEGTANDGSGYRGSLGLNKEIITADEGIKEQRMKEGITSLEEVIATTVEED